jgi:creatinine amidohydrolase
MSNTSRYWADWTTRDFAELQASGRTADLVAVLPVAAVEQHGPHLPLSVDTTIANGIVAQAVAHLAEQTSALFLPTQAVGLSPEHMAFFGTLSLKAETVLRLWTELGESVHAAGVRRLVLFNTHGGQAGVMDLVARDLRARLGMLVYSVNWYDLPLQSPEGEDLSARFSAHEHRFGIHGGEIETSLLLALAPQWVEMQRAQHFASTSEQRSRDYAILGNGRSAKFAWQTQDYNPEGAVGNAAAATADKGLALLDAAGRAFAQLLAEVQRVPLTTLVAGPSHAGLTRK